MNRRLAKHPSRGREQGYSLVETMVAGVVFLVTAVGVLPLFTHSMSNNNAGREALQAANHSKSELEELYQIPFHHADLTLAAGSDVVTNTDWWSLGDRELLLDAQEGWSSTDPGDGTTTWMRTVSIRQYGVGDLEDDGELNTPLDGDTDAIFVHLKEIQVQLDTTRSDGTALGVGRHVTMRVLKPF